MSTNGESPVSPTAEPSMALLKRWKSTPPWQAKRARASWYREYGGGGVDPATQVTLSERRPRPESPSKPTYEELAARTARKAELDNPNFDGTLTQDDLKIASPSTVTRWLEEGRLYRDLGGPPPGRH